jgi:hypothetical protein
MGSRPALAPAMTSDSEQVRAQLQPVLDEHLREGDLVALHGRAQPAGGGHGSGDRPRVRSGEQDAGLLDGLPDRGDHQRAGQPHRAAERLSPDLGSGPEPRDGLPVGRLGPAARKDVHAGCEGHGRLPAQE